ncbi:MAG: enoyl-CoA hydratase/isomerase family protein [Acidobacteria bacterium]|nr:enoyl-CoA hydratase/isomerase family protein [Acidobacteriota bacterium]
MSMRVLYECAGGVARITLNRPEKRNALDPVMVSELRAALDRAAEDGAARVVTLAGAGKDFCSGADLASVAAVARAGILENIEDARAIGAVFVAMRALAKPVVALVKGRALAGGCGLATACDLIVAAESARFGYPEINVGFVPAMVMALLRRAVGEKTAFALAVTGDVLTAARAREVGLVHAVFADDAFDGEAAEFVSGLAGKAGESVALTKQLLYRTDALPFEAALEAGVQTNAVSRMTESFRVGVERFLRK